MLSNFKYHSATLAGCSNQHYFETDGEKITSRALFKVFEGGKFEYSLLFSGTLDSSYRRISFHDEDCSDWVIHEARVGRMSGIRPGLNPTELRSDEDFAPCEWVPLTFGGEACRKAESGVFCSDSVVLDIPSGEFLCLEMTYSGKRIPCHPESAISIYKKTDTGWQYSINMPLPCMIGSSRPVVGNIAYLGDSITQGADMEVNCYAHWMARLAEKLPHHYSHWNLGIGLGKASDVSCKGIWYQKALTADTVFVCYGVNDVNADKSADVICSEIKTIVTSLKELGKRVILQTVPPFNYPEARRIVWEHVNEYIKKELSPAVDAIFDVTTILSKSKEEPHMTRFGGHPDQEGCELWAEALYNEIKHLFP